jgi:hypothetical protein
MLLQSIPVERESRRGTRSLKIKILRIAKRFPVSNSFALNILPLSPLDGIF